MRDVKTRAVMEQPKTRQQNVIPRTAVRILQRHYAQQKQERQTQRQRQPVEYATTQVQQGGLDAVRLTFHATRQLQRKYVLHKYRAQKVRQRRETTAAQVRQRDMWQSTGQTYAAQTATAQRTAAIPRQAAQKPPAPTMTTAQQRAKQHTHRAAQRQMLQQTKAAARKAGQRLEQMAQAVGKTVRAGIEAIAAAGGGVVLFLLLALPVVAIAVALSPAGILADSHTMEPTGEAMEVWERLPDDLSMERRMVVTYALALVDKVDYFWGGKSLVLGWDERWGELTEVTAEGGDSTGTEQPYGLDCSGFVDWAFYNASGGEYVIGQGGGAMEQHADCVDIEWDEVQPGDLLFYPEDEHVGIAAGRDWLGRLLVVHCASGTGGVAISHRTGFETAARPVWYEKES
ncbi:NlpC/P60 family protein [Vescimonas sp.]|uniref:NlpC/P60 family protein n=1 Tax=Vescimonas sp. TaxID=2892404 RepID=UPI003F7DC798